LTVTALQTSTVVLFRCDLRVGDHPALDAAVRHGGPVVPLFVWDPETEGDWAPGAASRWWLHHSLEAFAGTLASRKSRLLLRTGAAASQIADVARRAGARRVVWTRRYEPGAVRADAELERCLRADGVEIESHGGCLLTDPHRVRTGSGNAYRVFTPFAKACTGALRLGRVLAPPGELIAPPTWPQSLALDELGLLPRVDWAAGMRAAWRPGEAGARARLSAFVEAGGVDEYSQRRDRCDLEGTSRLSPHLHFGEISVREAWLAAERVAANARNDHAASSSEAFRRQLLWREFAHHLLFHYPHTAGAPLRAEFERFPWSCDPARLARWQAGKTGFPIVDAGMRELWSCGWMHNRVRMVVASFLVKDLQTSWLEGARWFWDTLVDADLANNSLGWQWTAGCGADAAPYFRIFHPVRQGQKFDPEGAYVRRWIPELRSLPTRWIHEPWAAPEPVLREAGLVIGRDYPAPVVDHAEARKAALAAFERIRKRER